VSLSKEQVLDGATYGRHVANTIERSVVGGDAGCCYSFCSDLLKLTFIIIGQSHIADFDPGVQLTTSTCWIYR